MIIEKYAVAFMVISIMHSSFLNRYATLKNGSNDSKSQETLPTQLYRNLAKSLFCYHLYCKLMHGEEVHSDKSAMRWHSFHTWCSNHIGDSWESMLHLNIFFVSCSLAFQEACLYHQIKSFLLQHIGICITQKPDLLSDKERMKDKCITQKECISKCVVKKPKKNVFYFFG